MVSSSRRVRLVSATLGFSSTELMIWLWISCNFATLAFSQNNFYTNGRYGKREESVDPVGEVFLSGSRYGRSGGIMNIKNSPKGSVMTPRVDRFYTGSRYGKRAQLQLYNFDSWKELEAALNYLYREQHAELIKREDSTKYDSDIEDSDVMDKQEPKLNPLVLCEMLNTSRC